MNDKTIPKSRNPEFKSASFDCPYCNVYSSMSWESLYESYKDYEGCESNYSRASILYAYCSHCNEKSYWLDTSEGRKPSGKMIMPNQTTSPMPHKDLPPACKKDFQEAREVATISPRSAAALLRLCLQKLCKELGGEGKNINDDIKKLVDEGLPLRIQKALDIIRVVGNNAVHPGKMSLEDDTKTVNSLFDLINLIVNDQIFIPKEIEEMRSNLPKSSRDQIEERDKKPHKMEER